MVYQCIPRVSHEYRGSNTYREPPEHPVTMSTLTILVEPSRQCTNKLTLWILKNVHDSFVPIFKVHFHRTELVSVDLRSGTDRVFAHDNDAKQCSVQHPAHASSHYPDCSCHLVPVWWQQQQQFSIFLTRVKAQYWIKMVLAWMHLKAWNSIFGPS